MVEYLIYGITFAFAAAVQPGPLQTFLISQTLSRGWKNTLPAVFAPVISDWPIVLLVLFILTKIPSDILGVLQICGGIFILYLSYNAYRTYKDYNNPGNRLKEKDNQSLIKAIVVNLLNPNPYIGWSLVMGPLLIKGWNENPINGIMLVVSFYFTFLIGLSLTVFLAAAAGKIGSKTNKLLIGISAFALFCFGIYQLFAGADVYFGLLAK